MSITEMFVTEMTYNRSDNSDSDWVLRLVFGQGQQAKVFELTDQQLFEPLYKTGWLRDMTDHHRKDLTKWDDFENTPAPAAYLEDFSCNDGDSFTFSFYLRNAEGALTETFLAMDDNISAGQLFHVLSGGGELHADLFRDRLLKKAN